MAKCTAMSKGCGQVWKDSTVLPAFTSVPQSDDFIASQVAVCFHVRVQHLNEI